MKYKVLIIKISSIKMINNQFNQSFPPFNMNNNNFNNINMNQAMMNMNQMAGWNFNMNQQQQFFQMINSNPTYLMIWNQMLQNMMNNQCMPNNNMNMMNNQFMPNNNMNMMNNQCMPNMSMQGNVQNNQFQFQNNFNNMNNEQQNPYQINITFSDTTGRKKIVIQTEPNEHMSSVINKYINKSGDLNINIYIFNGKRINQSLTVAEQGLSDGVEINVSNVGEVNGAI